MSGLAERRLTPVRRAYRFVNRPYYWYRPAQIAVRLRTRAGSSDEPRLLRTAWGSDLYCWSDVLGRSIARTGVYDLAVTETLARLADPGETAVDVGANVGFASNLLAHAVGRDGRLVAFEPHPLVFATLARNVARWSAVKSLPAIDARALAISSSAGVLPLVLDSDTFADNRGTASLGQSDSDSSGTGAGEVTHVTDVTVTSLDEEFSGPIEVLKLDVEGHELEALQGASSLLSGRLIRDLLFEEHRPPPTPVTTLLESHGYTVLGVRQGLAGPILSLPADAHARALWDPPALLATSDPERARARLKRRGWTSLRRDIGRP